MSTRNSCQVKNSKPKIIFFGTPEFGAIILEKLIGTNYKPILVITAPDKPVGRKQVITPPPVKVVAEKYIIPVIQPTTLTIPNFKFLISKQFQNFNDRNFKPDLFVVASYGKILPKEILDIPKYGCLNVHPSLLPKYRGPSPIQSAILNGDKETGVTIMLMKEKLDAGAIVANTKYKIQDTRYTYEELHNKLAELGKKLLIEIIPRWIEGKIKPEPQNNSKATYSRIIKREDGKIDWKKSADYIERQVRAFNPWPGTYTIQEGKILKILKVEISNGKLIIKEVQPEGKKPMSFGDFLRGYPDFRQNSQRR